MFWPHDEPVGKRFNAFSGDASIEVVGVTSTGQYEELFEPPKPFFYVPAGQSYFSYRTIHIRTALPPASMQREIDAQIHSLAPTAAVPQVRTMLDALEGVNGFFFFRFGAQITVCTGLLGLFLAVVGVYSTASYAAAQRTQEIGIRMALGADPQAILRMVFRQSLVTIAVGLTIGLGAALAATRGLAALISGIRPTDPLTFITVFLLLSAVSLLACWVPARRATRVDPLTALRYE
jgi:predicted lysophospholipase L1 biosynthesis ABC-type transport system permease subunit